MGIFYYVYAGGNAHTMGGLFLIGFSSVRFNLLAGVLFLVAIMTYFMGLDTGKEVLRMLGISFIVFIIPHIGEWIGPYRH